MAQETPDQVDYYSLRSLATACLCPQEHQGVQEEVVASRWLWRVLTKTERFGKTHANIQAIGDECQGWRMNSFNESTGFGMPISSSEIEDDWQNLSIKAAARGEEDTGRDTMIDKDEYSMIEDFKAQKTHPQDSSWTDEQAVIQLQAQEHRTELSAENQDLGSILASYTSNFAGLPTSVRLIGRARTQDDGIRYEEGEFVYAFFKVMLGLGWKVVNILPGLITYTPLLGTWQQLMIGIVVSLIRLAWRCWAVGKWIWGGMKVVLEDTCRRMHLKVGPVRRKS